MEKHSQESESNYPYVAKASKCHDNSKLGEVKVTGHNIVESKSVAALRKAITVGPTCIGINASSKAFQNYKKGILNPTECEVYQDHAITAVGYGEEKGVKYVIVRNSWADDWGENGYIRIATQND